jgi:hypothetical protein
MRPPAAQPGREHGRISLELDDILRFLAREAEILSYQELHPLSGHTPKSPGHHPRK